MNISGSAFHLVFHSLMHRAHLHAKSSKENFQKGEYGNVGNIFPEQNLDIIHSSVSSGCLPWCSPLAGLETEAAWGFVVEGNGAIPLAISLSLSLSLSQVKDFLRASNKRAFEKTVTCAGCHNAITLPHGRKLIPSPYHGCLCAHIFLISHDGHVQRAFSVLEKKGYDVTRIGKTLNAFNSITVREDHPRPDVYCMGLMR